MGISPLIEGLNSIVFWLLDKQKKYPHITQNWWLRSSTVKASIPYRRSKLSQDEIANLERQLAITFTPEIYELYQWFNGTEFGDSIWDSDWLFDVNLKSQAITGVGILSLESVVKEYLEKQNFYQEENYQYLPAIPYSLTHLSGLDTFVGNDSLEGCFVIERNAILSPIRIRSYQAGSNHTIAMYSSLTNMAITIAESYHQAYNFDSKGNVEKDLAKIKTIWQKYNANYFINKTLTRFQNIKTNLIEQEQDISAAWIQELGDILELTNNENLLQQLFSILAQPPSKTIWDVNLDYLRSQASKIIIKTKHKRAVSYLLKLLNSPHWLTRYWAVQTLGKLKNPSVINALQQLLQDEQESIRIATQKAIDNLQQIEDTPSLTLVEPEALKIDREKIIKQTNYLMKFYNFSIAEGRNYLLQHYNKRSRQHLSDRELLEFYQYLKNRNRSLTQHQDYQLAQDCQQQQIIEIDFNDLIKQIDRLMKQLNWTKEDGETYLLTRYRKKSRYFLTDEEILEFKSLLEQEQLKRSTRTL